MPIAAIPIAAIASGVAIDIATPLAIAVADERRKAYRARRRSAA